ncbi:MAG TPA: small basic protein [Candidatus Brocadiia bacterium]|nr:small basic protein [Candidatus Brocadiia bacterium]
MSRDKSLKIASGLVRQRGTLTRTERLAILREDGRWADGNSVYGLPKVRVRIVKAKKGPAKKPGEEGAEGTEQAAASATPAK